MKYLVDGFAKAETADRVILGRARSRPDVRFPPVSSSLGKKRTMT
jgi:hypothetical protein